MSKLASILNSFEGNTTVYIAAVRANSFLLDPLGVWSHKVCIHVAPEREWSSPKELHEYVKAMIGMEPDQWSKQPDDRTWPAEILYKEVIATDKVKATRTITMNDSLYVGSMRAFDGGVMVVDESDDRDVSRLITVLVHHDAEEAVTATKCMDGLSVVSVGGRLAHH